MTDTKTPFNNEFDLTDNIDCDAAVAAALAVQSKINELKKELDWYATGFRKFYTEGKTHITDKGQYVNVQTPNDPTQRLNKKLVEEKYNIAFSTHSTLYNEFEPRKQAVTFRNQPPKPREIKS